MIETVREIALRTWLAKVPVTWTVQPAKRIFRITKERSFIENPQVLSLTRSGVVERDVSGNDGQIAASYVDYASVQPGDFVLNPMDLIAGWVAVTPHPGVVSNAYITFRLKDGSDGEECEARYFEYLFGAYYNDRILNPFGKGLGRSESGGGRWTLNADTFLNFPVPVPPIEDQRAISAFLDRRLHAIDELIQKQVALAEKLYARRSSLITQAVLDGALEQKRDRRILVDWLPPLPTNWDIAPLWACYRRTKKVGSPELDLLALYREHGVIKKDSRDDNHNVESEDLSSYQVVRVGDLVVNKMKAWQGSISLSTLEGIISPAYFVYTPLHASNSKYFHYLLRSAPYVAHYNRISKGVRVGQWDLDPQHFRTLPLCIPPLEEQELIVAFLDEQLKLNSLTMDKNLEIVKKLQERRAALISAAVMGKIDIRGEN